eukprot:10198258-Ditylum_brightwellii.AAC.1
MVVSLCSTFGNATPVLILEYLTELSKEVDDRTQELTRVHTIVRGDEGIQECQFHQGGKRIPPLKR